MVIIIDGNQLACKCYFSLSPLTNSSGKRTETIYGFLGSFKKYIKTYQDNDTHIFVTWDGGNDKRKSIFPDYKAGRKKFEDAFYEQLDSLRKILKCIGIKQYHIKSVEADDLIGTLTFKSRKKGKKVLIISSDHDFEQLISRHVKVIHTIGKKTVIKDEQFVLDNYGITPNRLSEVMALTGDPTDNIPGIEGIGDKTAAKLVLANGSLKNIIDNPDDLKIFNKSGLVVDAKSNLKQKIKSSVNNIKIAYDLVRLRYNIDVEPDFSVQKTDFENLKNLFETLEFRLFLNEFERWTKCFKSK